MLILHGTKPKHEGRKILSRVEGGQIKRSMTRASKIFQLPLNDAEP